MRQGNETQTHRPRPLWLEYWPIWLSAGFVASLAFLGLGYPVAFFGWHRLLACCLLFAIVLNLALRQWVWPKPKPFQRSAVEEVFLRARRFWLLSLQLNLVLFAGVLLLGWALVWLFGPRGWLVLVLAVSQAIGLTALLGIAFWRLPPTLALVWGINPNKVLSWTTWRREFVLSDQLAFAIAHDLKKEGSQILHLVRVLDQSDPMRLSAGQDEWSWRKAIAALGRKARDQALLAGGLIVSAFLLTAMLLGGRTLSAFPPGFEQDQAFQRAFFQQIRDEAGSLSPEALGKGDGDGSGAAKDAGSTSAKGSDGAGQAGASTGGTAGEGEGGEAMAADDPSGDSSSSQPEPPTYPRDGEKSQNTSQTQSQSQVSQKKNEANPQQRDASELPNPGMPGLRPGDGEGKDSQDGAQKDGKGQGSGEKGAPAKANGQGDGDSGGATQTSKPGDGKGKGKGSPTGVSKPQTSDESSEGKGSKAGPRELEQGGGGPFGGKPGPPSPPDPAFQELVNIEVPPVEAGRLKRLNVSETPQQATQGATDDAFTAEGQRSETQPDSGTSQQTLPNWILQMMRNAQANTPKNATQKPPP